MFNSSLLFKKLMTKSSKLLKCCGLTRSSQLSLQQTWPLWWRISLSIRVQTTLSHCRSVTYHNINVKQNDSFSAWHVAEHVKQRCLYYYQQRHIGRLPNYCQLIVIKKKNFSDNSSCPMSAGVRISTIIVKNNSLSKCALSIHHPFSFSPVSWVVPLVLLVFLQRRKEEEVNCLREEVNRKIV